MMQKARAVCCAQQVAAAKPGASNIVEMTLLGGYTCGELAGAMNISQASVMAGLREGLNLVRQPV
jgi:hypothetical protein